MKESALQKNTIELAELRGYMVYHVSRRAREVTLATTGVGFPDLVMAKEGKRLIFAELKSNAYELTDNQKLWGAHLACKASIAILHDGDNKRHTAEGLSLDGVGILRLETVRLA